MALIKWEPFSDIDRFFGDLPASILSKQGWDLAVDVYEKDDKVIAEMNLPGIDPEKIEVSVEGNQLRIAGFREEEKETEKSHYYSKEIRRGSFERTVTLPCAVKEDSTAAEYEKGRLKVTMPKDTEAKKGKVVVEVKK